MLEEEQSLIEDRKKWREEATAAELLRLKDKDKRYQKINKVLKYVIGIQAILIVVVGIGYLTKYVSDQNKRKAAVPVELKKAVKDVKTIETKNKIIYSVQISTYKNVSLEDFKEEMVNIGQYTYEDLKQFTLGKFESYTDAVEFQKRIKKIGLPDAFIVASYNDVRIPITDAISRSHDQKLREVTGDSTKDDSLKVVK